MLFFLDGDNQREGIESISQCETKLVELFF